MVFKHFKMLNLLMNVSNKKIVVISHNLRLHCGFFEVQINK